MILIIKFAYNKYTNIVNKNTHVIRILMIKFIYEFYSKAYIIQKFLYIVNAILKYVC
jgi:hypothetical protein